MSDGHAERVQKQHQPLFNFNEADHRKVGVAWVGEGVEKLNERLKERLLEQYHVRLLAQLTDEQLVQLQLLQVHGVLPLAGHLRPPEDLVEDGLGEEKVQQWAERDCAVKLLLLLLVLLAGTVIRALIRLAVAAAVDGANVRGALLHQQRNHLLDVIQYAGEVVHGDVGEDLCLHDAPRLRPVHAKGVEDGAFQRLGVFLQRGKTAAAALLSGQRGGRQVVILVVMLVVLLVRHQRVVVLRGGGCRWGTGGGGGLWQGAGAEAAGDSCGGTRLSLRPRQLGQCSQGSIFTAVVQAGHFA